MNISRIKRTVNHGGVTHHSFMETDRFCK